MNARRLEAQLLSAFRRLSEERQARLVTAVITELACGTIHARNRVPAPSLRLVVDNTR
jgi:hypothetical protein